ncbi:hypothetical protein [Chitinibacter sp. S2-10]|uniref:hypothetical protein n=1 Tax=Chitinibacter sp. S2-10 TaxID=3373597 RepID=UPI003977B7E6
MNKTCVAIAILSLGLAACGQKDEPYTGPKIAEPARAALDKAKEVGSEVQQQAADQQKQIDEATK